jgi:hypothetical protein
MSKSDNDKTPNNRGDATNPGVTVTAPLSKSEAYATHGGQQKSEAHYKAIVQKAAKDGDQGVYSKRRK